jgi:hypothetical protein
MNSAGITNAGLPGLTVSNVNIEDSLAYGVAIEASQPLDNAILKNVLSGRIGAARFPWRLGQSAGGGKHDP